MLFKIDFFAVRIHVSGIPVYLIHECCQFELNQKGKPRKKGHFVQQNKRWQKRYNPIQIQCCFKFFSASELTPLQGYLDKSITCTKTLFEAKVNSVRAALNLGRSMNSLAEMDDFGSAFWGKLQHILQSICLLPCL